MKYTKIDMLLSFLKGAIHFFVFAFLFTCLSSLMEMIRPKIIEYTVDGLLQDDLSTLPKFLISYIQTYGISYFKNHLIFIGLSIIIVSLLSVIFNYLYQICISKGSELFVKKMRDALFEHMEHATLKWQAEHSTGDIIQRCTMDVEEIKSFLSEQLVTFIRMVITIVFVVIFMLQVNVKLSCITIIIIPIMVIVSFIFHQKISSSFLICDESEGELSNIIQENLTGVRVVRAFGQERNERIKFSKQNIDVRDKWIEVSKHLSVFWGWTDFISGLTFALVLTLGTIMCIHKELTLGGLLAFISYVTLLIRPVRSLGRILSEMSKTEVSLNRIYELMSAPLEDENKDLKIDMRQDITFDHVSYSFDHHEVLHDISFTIPYGTTLGILGNTASGKSTIAHLLSCLYPLDKENGTIYIGDTNLQDINIYWVRKNVGYVLQEPFLFSRSIKDNISIANASLSMDEIRKYSKAAALEKTIDNFNKGFDTFVGERGVTLSGGQKQRAAIARTLTLNAPILIFDDSLSAVDTKTDEEIRRNLKAYMGNVTTIIISHRISTLMDSDQIIVLEDGKLKDHGTHKELISRPGLYRKIYDIQQGKEEFV